MLVELIKIHNQICPSSSKSIETERSTGDCKTPEAAFTLKDLNTTITLVTLLLLAELSLFSHLFASNAASIVGVDRASQVLQKRGSICGDVVDEINRDVEDIAEFAVRCRLAINMWDEV